MKKKVLAISGSTRAESANGKLIQAISGIAGDLFEVVFFENISLLPHFNPDLDRENPPTEISAFRQQIAEADGVLICTPEYVFSLPGSLKNALEWTVSTLVFSNKPLGLITASANGKKGHAELKLVMKTLGGKFRRSTCLLIQGIKGKVSADGHISDEKTRNEVVDFVAAFGRII